MTDNAAAPGRVELFASLMDGWFWETDQDHRFTYMSASVETITGVVPEWHYGKRRTEIRSIGIDEVEWAEHLATLEAREPFSDFLFKRIGPDGEKWLTSSGKPRFDAGGQFLGYSGIGKDVTARAKSEQQVAIVEQRLREAIDSVDDGFALFDADDRLVIFNSGYLEVYAGHADVIQHGRTFEYILREGVKRNDYAEAIGREEDWIRERVARHLNPGKPFEQVLSDGRVVRIAEYKTSDGGILGIRSDITERKQAEDALKISEANLKAIFDNAPVEIYLKDVEGRYVQINRQFEKLFNVRNEDLVGKFPADAHDPELGKLTRAHDLEVLKTGQVVIREEDALTELGPRVLHTIKFPVFDDDKKITGLGAIVSDITERKQAEIALRSSESRYHEIFNDSPFALWVEDWSKVKQMLDLLKEDSVEDWHVYFADHRDHAIQAYDLIKILQISNATLDLYAASSRQDYIASIEGSKVLPEEIDAFIEIVIGFLEGVWDIDIASWDDKMDGTKIMVRTTGVMPPAHRHDWSRLIYALEDITDQTNLEDQLRQSQRMEAIGQLTGGIAHDFNNLMAVILGNLEVALEEPHTDYPVRERIETALNAVQNAAILTQKLLSFSRQQALSPKVTYTNELITDTLKFLERTLGEDIKIITALDDAKLSINIDAAIFGNALVNLALNARDAMPDGGTLTIQTTPVDLDGERIGGSETPAYGPYVKITVADTGVGIDAEDIGHVFEPFFTTKEAGQGSGLGLSMVYGFVQQSDGHINVTSHNDEGTAIDLYLPLTDEGVNEQAKKRPSNASAPEGKTILLVEDDPEVRKTTTLTLSRIGYEVIEAEDGPTALDILDRNSDDIHLVLSDVVMPNNMSGIELAKLVAVRHKNVKVLLISGYPDKIADQEGLRELGVGLLAKPFRRAQLAIAIEQATSDQSGY